MKWYVHMIVAMGLLLIGGCSSQPETDDIDGGVRHYVDESLPKEIQSTEITYFHCRFSSLDRVLADTPIAGQIFTLTATKESCTCEIRDRDNQITSQTFIPDAGFFTRLQDVVSHYDMARENGRHYKVSGLPPNFGIALEVQYASGEQIRTSDNQNCFLSNEAMEELVALFQQK